MAENQVYLSNIVVTRCVVAKITHILVIIGLPKIADPGGLSGRAHHGFDNKKVMQW